MSISAKPAYFRHYISGLLPAIYPPIQAWYSEFYFFFPFPVSSFSFSFFSLSFFSFSSSSKFSNASFASTFPSYSTSSTHFLTIKSLHIANPVITRTVPVLSTLFIMPHIVMRAIRFSSGVTRLWRSCYYQVWSVGYWGPVEWYGIVTSKSGLTQYISASRDSRIINSNITVRTWMTASKIEISLVVRKTLKPAATSGVTCSNAALIWREYGRPILCSVGLRVVWPAVN